MMARKLYEILTEYKPWIVSPIYLTVIVFGFSPASYLALGVIAWAVYDVVGISSADAMSMTFTSGAVGLLLVIIAINVIGWLYDCVCGELYPAYCRSFSRK